MKLEPKKGSAILHAAEIIFLIIGILALVYYGVIVCYAGIGVSFGWFWLFAGAGAVILSVLLKWLEIAGIHLPKAVLAVCASILLAGLLLFILVLGRLVFSSLQKPEPDADYMIILGAQIRGERITKSLKKRLDTAAVYLEQNPGTQAIVSGGQGRGEDIPESLAMKKYLVSRGIPEHQIIEENKSTNTNENIRFSKEYIEESKRVVIVTNGFHMYRGSEIGKKQGIGIVEGLSAPTDHVLLINQYVREVFAVIKDKLVGNI